MYDKFKQLLNERKITPYRVYKETGISTATLSDWKNGKSQPKKDKIEKLCEYFNVPLSYFYGTEELKKQDPALNKKDERDIKKDLENLREKLANKELGPAAFGGNDIPDDDTELFLGQVELMLRRLKVKNKEKYNPRKNTK